MRKELGYPGEQRYHPSLWGEGSAAALVPYRPPLAHPPLQGRATRRSRAERGAPRQRHGGEPRAVGPRSREAGRACSCFRIARIALAILARASGARGPISRVLCRPRTGATIIPLDRPLLDGSRDLPGRLRPMTALPLAGRGIPIRSCSWRGLPCRPCHQVRGGLLPHPFTLTGLARPEVCFLWRYPSGRPGRRLSAAFSPWSPDFPRQGQAPAATARPSGEG